MSPFSAEATFPPSLEGNAILAMLTVMAFWSGILICLQWLYEMFSESRAYPAPKGTYFSTSRIVIGALIWAAFISMVPRLGQLMLWQVVGPEFRMALASAAWWSRIPATALVIYAWWRKRQLVATERSYAFDHGVVNVRLLSRAEKTRGVLILTLVFAVAFATTFVRPVDAHSSVSHVIEHG